MSAIIPGFAKELDAFGAKHFNTCYDCGNCTAVCSLTEENANFPRMMIRYGKLGQKEAILQSEELWLCYACGECSESCPRGADPGEYLSAMRRYAISKYEPSGLASLIFKSNPWYIVISLGIAIVLGFFLFTLRPDFIVSRWIFEWMPFDVIHDMGIWIFILVGIFSLSGITRMIMHLLRKHKKKNFFSIKNIGKALLYVIEEISTMKRYRNCEEENGSILYNKPQVLQPWFIHWSIMWGFIGLLVATILDFIFKDPATSIWLPSRLLGTLAGILMMYGSSLAIIYRLRKINKTYANSTLNDWIFLSFLWLAGFTGFWLEVAIAINGDAIINQVVFVLHTIISMELVLLFTFSKFAHALYRPVALFFYKLSGQ